MNTEKTFYTEWQISYFEDEYLYETMEKIWIYIIIIPKLMFHKEKNILKTYIHPFSPTVQATNLEHHILYVVLQCIVGKIVIDKMTFHEPFVVRIDASRWSYLVKKRGRKHAPKP